jgi:hypothetical protein
MGALHAVVSIGLFSGNPVSANSSAAVARCAQWYLLKKNNEQQPRAYAHNLPPCCCSLVFLKLAFFDAG